MTVKALLFDVFGTLVDWRGSIARQMAPHLPEASEAPGFADAWRAKYQPAMEEVRAGRRPFVRLDTLHRENLDATLEEFGAADTSDDTREAMTLYWHRLDAWPDVGDGLVRLAEHFLLAPHSNGNVRLMVDLARHNSWRWDAILGAETTGHYKPQPESYLRAADILMLAPAECVMVAAHNADLAAARALGLRTAFVPRPTEHGEGQNVDLEPSEAWDVVAEDLAGLLPGLRGL